MRNVLKQSFKLVLLFLRDVLDFFFHFQEVSILCYHSISNDTSIDTTITPAVFARQIEFLRSKGYAFVSLDEVLAWLDGKKKLPEKAIALTFDDGYNDFETTTLPILKRFTIPATQFVVGNPAAAREAIGNQIPLLSAETIEQLKKDPLVEIGFHSMTHANLAHLSGEALKQEIARSVLYRFFAYPGGNHSPEVVSAVEEAGYDAAFSIGQGLVTKDANRYLVRRNVVLNDVSLAQVRFMATRALSWYLAIIKPLKGFNI